MLNSPGIVLVDKEEIRQIQRQIEIPIGGGTVDQLVLVWTNFFKMPAVKFQKIAIEIA